ncbi:hypothetical protein NLJ89_g3465 [Agrocybe chaxingu]|uniref:Gfd2/YDR514C-like C-terminal domain-containing protein n=1 Tax=Agrocybe chaxingu TaxID=84603 RepID=A0A9W8MVH0_9AGAR|nr:hypothetical protein NLJ89_g3465 [Agrocybe chaxingu]
MPAADVPVVTGYYRYTDIWFEWSKVLPDEDAQVLKAILAHDCIVDHEHPLHIEGIKGVQLYMGTFETGEARLLFSSKQVDYIRYWLHAMQLTKEMIPLPYSDCMLTEANLRTVSPVVYESGSALHDALKLIEKNNRRLKGSNPRLTSRRHLFERVRAFWAQKKGVWCAVDFEAWERDHTVLTEFGWSLTYWKDGSQVQKDGHLIVEEAKKYMNGTYVKDHRYRYDFGDSECVKKSVFKERIHQLFARLSELGYIFLVFHDNRHDIRDLQKLEVNLDGLTYLPPDSIPEKGIFVLDTADLIGALLGVGDNRGLEKTCRLLQITTQYLHNAGNDAHYTLQAMQAMASGDPVDIQREKRWPNQISKGLGVNLKPWQEDSDYSDEEGVLPPMAGFAAYEHELPKESTSAPKGGIN